MRLPSSIVATYFALQRCAKLCCNRRMRLCRGYAGESRCTRVFDNSGAMTHIRKIGRFSNVSRFDQDSGWSAHSNIVATRIDDRRKIELSEFLHFYVVM